MIQFYEHQHTGMSSIIERDGGLLADNMGLGKTLTSLGAAQKMRHHWGPAVAVVPASVKFNWEKEAKLLGMSTRVCEGFAAPEHGGPVPDLTILNYAIVEPDRRQRKKKIRSWSDYIRKEIKPGFFIFDEAHDGIGSRKTHRLKPYIERLVSDQPDSRILCVTGTPFDGLQVDLFPILELVWPKIFNSFWSFAESYSRPRLTPWGWNFNKNRNADHLHENMKRLGMIRRTQTSVELPPKRRRVKILPLDDVARYRECLLFFKQYIRKYHPAQYQRVSRAARLAQPGYLLRLAAQQKMKYVAHWARDQMATHPGEKLVLFVMHHAAVDYLSKSLKGFKQIHITGKITGRRRQRNIDQFQTDPETELAIVNLNAGAVGINLTAARHAGVAEFHRKPGVHMQAEKRIHRIGQLWPCVITYLVTKGTIEIPICQVLQQREKVMRTAIDGKLEDDGFDLYKAVQSAIHKGIVESMG